MKLFTTSVITWKNFLEIALCSIFGDRIFELILFKNYIDQNILTVTAGPPCWSFLLLQVLHATRLQKFIRKIRSRKMIHLNLSQKIEMKFSFHSWFMPLEIGMFHQSDLKLDPNDRSETTSTLRSSVLNLN